VKSEGHGIGDILVGRGDIGLGGQDMFVCEFHGMSLGGVLNNADRVIVELDRIKDETRISKRQGNVLSD
jgi:hypothetical protein